MSELYFLNLVSRSSVFSLRGKKKTLITKTRIQRTLLDMPEAWICPVGASFLLAQLNSTIPTMESETAFESTLGFKSGFLWGMEAHKVVLWILHLGSQQLGFWNVKACLHLLSWMQTSPLFFWKSHILLNGKSA